MNQNSRRLLELDSLRGIAALLVCFFHFTTDYNHRFGHHPGLIFEVPLGFYGVHLFFIISGFVILMTLERTERGFDFILSRFARLYPAYWVSVILNIALAAFYQFPITLKGMSVKELLLNFTMLQNAFGVGILDSVYWTLQVELYFYALLFCFHQLKWLGKIENLALVWLTVKVLASFLPVRILLLEYGQLFIAGMMFYKIYRDGFSMKRLAIIAVCFLMQVWQLKEWGSSFLIASFMLSFFLLVSGRLKWIKNPFLVYLGTISYSFYLLHHNLGYAMIKKFYERNLSPNLNVVLTACVFLVLASLTTFFIEKPSQAAIKIAAKQGQLKKEPA